MADILTALLGMGLFAWVSLPAERDSKPRNASTTIRETLSHQGNPPGAGRLWLFHCPHRSIWILGPTVGSSSLWGTITASSRPWSWRGFPACAWAAWSWVTFGAHRLLAHPVWVSGALWRSVGCNGLGGSLSPVSLLDGGFRCSAHRCANHHHHTAPRNRPTGWSGKAFGLLSACYAGALPLGMAIFGPMADVIPLPCLMTLAGVLLLGIAGKYWANPAKYGIMRRYKNLWACPLTAEVLWIIH